MRRALPRIHFPLPRRAGELAARARLESARRPWVRWVAVGTCALAVALTVERQAGALERARARWGEQQTVLVADHAVARGATVGPHDVRRVQLPVAALPSGAIAELPAAAIAVDGLAAGEVVSAAHVRSRGTAGLPPGTSGVAVPIADGGLRPTTGQLVDVVDAGDPLGASGSPGDPPATVLTRRAIVVEASATGVVLAVATAAAPSVAAAAARGAVVLILSEI